MSPSSRLGGNCALLHKIFEATDTTEIVLSFHDGSANDHRVDFTAVSRRFP